MDSYDCSICFHQFVEPRVCPCGHSFCLSCLSSLKQNQLLCPLCRTPFSSVASLPPNWVVLNWIDQNKDQPTLVKKTIMCQSCEKDVNPATVWCENCSQTPETPSYYCKSCDTTEHSHRLTKNHVRISLHEKSKRPIFSKCSRHYKDNEFYCSDCKTLLCNVCALDDHQGHKTMSAFKYTDGLRDELKACITPFKNLEKLEQMLNEVRITKQKKVEEVINLKAKLEVLEQEIMNHDTEINKMTERQEKIKTSHMVLIKSVEELGMMELLDKENVVRMKNQIQEVFQQIYPEQKIPVYCSIVLKYTSDFDGKGLIYWLGTSRGTTPFKNPMTEGLILLTSSGLTVYTGGSGKERELFEGHLACHDIYFEPPYSSPQSCWFQIDLMTNLIAPTMYTLRAACGTPAHATGVPRNWALEGSIDSNLWTTLIQHNNDTKLPRTLKATASWPIPNPQHTKFRYIRFRQTGPTEYSSPNYLIFGGFEIYGTVFLAQ